MLNNNNQQYQDESSMRRSFSATNLDTINSYSFDSNTTRTNNSFISDDTINKNNHHQRYQSTCKKLSPQNENKLVSFTPAPIHRVISNSGYHQSDAVTASGETGEGTPKLIDFLGTSSKPAINNNNTNNTVLEGLCGGGGRNGSLAIQLDYGMMTPMHKEPIVKMRDLMSKTSHELCMTWYGDAEESFYKDDVNVRIGENLLKK